MMERVYIPISISNIDSDSLLPSKTYKVDFGTGRITSEMIDGKEAVKQAIRKAIITPRFKCLIYDNQYGSEIKENIQAHNATKEYLQTVVPECIKDAFLPDRRIIDAHDFNVEIKDDGVYISFVVDTVFGETEITEVV